MFFPQVEQVAVENEIGPFNLENPGICPALYLLRVPQIGYYAKEYLMGQNLILAKVAPPSHLPSPLRGINAAYYLQILDMTGIKHKTLNFVAHPFAFPNLQPAQTAQATVQMGLFLAEDSSIRSAKKHGIAVGKIRPERVVVQPVGNSMCCSPNNARFTCNRKLSYNTFWSYCQKGNRRIVCYHVLINDRNLSEKLYQQLLTEDALPCFNFFKKYLNVG